MTAPMPTMQEIAFDETVTWTVDEWKAYAKRLHGEWREAARRGVEADAEIARQEDLCRLSNATYKNIAEKAEAELAALKVERDEAVRREREACASYAENHDLGTPDGHDIAKAIRARKGEHDEH